MDEPVKFDQRDSRRCTCGETILIGYLVIKASFPPREFATPIEFHEGAYPCEDFKKLHQGRST